MLKNGELLPSVNKSYVKTAPQGAIVQLGHSLMQMIHLFEQSDKDMKNFMEKWDIKYVFWRLNCALGEEWNFEYVLPHEKGEEVRLLVPTSLQIGWIK